MKNSILKLNAVHKRKPWGWEDWNLCCHKEGVSIIENYDIEEKNLWKYLNFKDFPILVKNIMAIKDLSIQVHPGHEFARMVEKDNGKSECWYILDSKENSYIYYGLKENVSYEKLKDILYNGTIEEFVHRVPVKRGDFIYIPAGTIHAIGAGIELLEIQQNSNITYRIYDYNRGRELHLEKALHVIDLKNNLNIKKIDDFKIFKSNEFIIEKIRVSKSGVFETLDKFQCIFILEGEGEIKNLSSGEVLELKEKDTFFIESGIEYEIKGNIEFIKTGE
ncbi:class I mannose-6-phosphate isomerase [Hathewaya histolytica]|uniref:Mannose-6-phosphate isomerase n=1 Tax=Hathewaya histolytica TaxID=1498 RepID=A0A4U9RYN9_HATHI|nr:class I mannose-6-phosphate isomerase [Hathewaya histolytica]VTQ94330.1 mannose-6-phosphate isomerase [Hathewaya histolytica]